MDIHVYTRYILYNSYFFRLCSTRHHLIESYLVKHVFSHSFGALLLLVSPHRFSHNPTHHPAHCTIKTQNIIIERDHHIP